METCFASLVAEFHSDLGTGAIFYVPPCRHNTNHFLVLVSHGFKLEFSEDKMYQATVKFNFICFI